MRPTVLHRLPPSVAQRLPSRLGDWAGKPVVSCVRLQGLIAAGMSPLSRGMINLSSLEPVLQHAFQRRGLAAVALLINSPGGSATQSALVAERIRSLAAEHEVPVLAFCEDVAASGGYWLACAADEVYAHPTSIVGSIGVVSSGFGLAGLLERLGVERRLHTAGENKARLDPFLPEDPDDVQWLTGLQGELHKLFQDWVRERRGAKLDRTKDLFTGEVWTGADALEVGLVDGLGSARAVLKDRFPDAEPVAAQGRRSLFARLGVGGSHSLLGAAHAAPNVALSLVEAAELRASWARFGL
ncbi:MAG: S49 family peptidase [Pseudonocardia sp.]